MDDYSEKDIRDDKLAGGEPLRGEGSWNVRDILSHYMTHQSRGLSLQHLVLISFQKYVSGTHLLSNIYKCINSKKLGNSYKTTKNN